MNKRKILSLLFAGSVLGCFAQVETDPERGIQFKANPKYRSTTMSLGSAALKNSYISPLSYNGFSMGAHFGETQYKKRGVFDWAIATDFDVADDFNLIQVGMKFETYWHSLVYRKDNLFFYAGAGALCDVEVTQNGNSMGYNAVSITGNLSLLPSAMLKWRFRLFNQNFDFSQQLSTPLAGVGIYPRFSSEAYGSLSDENSLETGSTFSSLHNSSGLSGRTYLDWRRRNKETGKENNSFFRIGYHYDGFRLNYDNNAFQSGRSVFTIGYVIKL